MSVGGDGFDLDRLLDQELRRAAARLEGPSPRVGQSAYHAAVAAGGTVLSFSSLSSFLTSKVTIAATAALLLAGGAAVTAAAATGSGNPTNWGSLVVQVVQGCKTTVGTGPTAASCAPKRQCRQRPAPSATVRSSPGRKRNTRSR